MTGKTIEEVALRANLNGNESVPFQEGAAYGRFQIKQLLRPEQVVNALNSDLTNVPLSAAQGKALKGLIDRINRDFGRYDTATNVTLTQATAGKYIDNAGAQQTNASYGISAAVTLAVGDILLIPSASAVLAACSIVSEVTTNAQGETVYVPLMKRTTAAISEQGYYCFLAIRPVNVVISGFTATVNGGTAIKVAWDIFKTIASTFETVFTNASSMLAELARKANIDGYYESMVVGTAKNLEGENLVDGTFISRTTGGDAEVGNGLAQIVEAKGKSLAWNQLVNTSNLLPSGTTNGVTYTFANGVITANGTAGPTTSFSDGALGAIYLSLIQGHKYYLGKGGGTIQKLIQIFSGSAGNRSYETNTSVSKIFTCEYVATDWIIRIRIANGVTVTNEKFTLNVIDLTLLGIDNLTTPEEVEAWLAENIGALEYYPYNAGTVLNNVMEGIEGLGFNLLDPATGTAQIIGAYDDMYGNLYGITGTHGTLTFKGIDGSEEIITPDAEGKFELTVPGVLTVATPGDDCAVFLWWDGSKTDFQPYEKSVAYLDVKHIYGKKDGAGDLVQIFPDGLAGVGSVKDLLHIEDGVTVAERKMRGVNLGSLAWTDRGDSVFSANFQDMRYNGICAKYTILYSGTPSNAGDKTLSMVPYYASQGIYIKDSAYSDVATFKTAMNGVSLFYELATPEHYTDLVYMGSEHFADGTPVELPTNYNVDNWSIENILPKNTTSAVVTGPAALTCKYSINAVETLNTHTDQIEDLYDSKADKNGAYPGLVAGNLVDGNGVGEEQQFVFRPTGGTEAVAPKTQAVLQKYMGRSLVWNQQISSENLNQSVIGETINGITTTYDSTTHKFHVEGTASADYDKALVLHNKTPKGHKVLLYAEGAPMGSTGNVRVYVDMGFAVYNGQITESNSNSGDVNLWLLVRSGEQVDFDFYAIVVDLTLMFGAGNEPATVAEFEALFPLPYYAYNAGTIISNKADSIETVGFNQWDEECRTGYYSGSDGTYNSSDIQLCTKNKIPVSPDTEYYIQIPSDKRGAVVKLFYDAEGNYITYASGYGLFTTPTNCRFINVNFGATSQGGYGTTYNHDICINLSDPAKNGTYEPYEKHSTQIGLGGFQVKDGEGNVITVNGLKSAGSVYDEIDPVKKKYIKRIGSVDMGDLTWVADNFFGFYRFLGETPSPASDNWNCVISEKYCIPSSNLGSTQEDKTIKQNSVYGLVVRDSAYSDAATFKAAMDGVMAYYELAEPVEYDLVGSIPETYPAFGGGTEAILPDGVDEETGVPETAPFRAVIFYSKDYLSQLNNMPEDYTSKDSLVNMLEAFKTAGIIAAYTMTWDATNHRYTFTITAPTPEP